MPAEGRGEGRIVGGGAHFRKTLTGLGGEHGEGQKQGGKIGGRGVKTPGSEMLYNVRFATVVAEHCSICDTFFFKHVLL